MPEQTASAPEPSAANGAAEPRWLAAAFAQVTSQRVNPRVAAPASVAGKRCSVVRPARIPTLMLLLLLVISICK